MYSHVLTRCRISSKTSLQKHTENTRLVNGMTMIEIELSKSSCHCVLFQHNYCKNSEMTPYIIELYLSHIILQDIY